MFYNSMLWTTEWLELLFPVLLGFLCKSKMADETQANEHSLQGFLKFRLFRAFPIRPLQGRGCWFLQCCFFFCGNEIGRHKNTWPLRYGCTILCSPLFSGAQKGTTPTPFATAHSPPPHPPLINDRSLILRMIISYLNHFLFHHYTICIFCVLFDMIVVTAAHSFVPQ